jgi:LuxR family maltose regulon positive regulatory protein
MIYLAVAKKAEDALTQASEYLRAALDIALPDGIYLPFAEFGTALLPLLATVRGTGKFDAAKMADLEALCKRQAAGAASINKSEEAQSKGNGNVLLTSREREIALLAKERLSAREIAARLYISENTVKTLLKNIYGKLAINSKTELGQKDF